MYIHDIETKDGRTRYLFYTNKAVQPKEVAKFYNENKEKIDNDEWSCYCDHFTITVKEWFRGKIPKDKVSEKTEVLEDGTCNTTYKIICKDVKRKR